MLWFLCIAMVNTHFLIAHTYTRNFIPIPISHPFFFLCCDKNNYKKKFHISQLLTRHKNNEFPPPRSHTFPFSSSSSSSIFIREDFLSTRIERKLKEEDDKKKSVKAQNFQFQSFVVMLLKAQKHKNGIRGRKFVYRACVMNRLRQFQWVTCECDIDLCAFVKHIDQKSSLTCSYIKCLPVPTHIHVEYLNVLVLECLTGMCLVWLKKKKTVHRRKCWKWHPKKKDFPTKSHLSFSDAVAQFRPIVEEARIIFF